MIEYKSTKGEYQALFLDQFSENENIWSLNVLLSKVTKKLKLRAELCFKTNITKIQTYDDLKRLLSANYLSEGKREIAEKFRKLILKGPTNLDILSYTYNLRYHFEENSVSSRRSKSNW